MIEWLSEHPEFYNKKLNQYKDTKSKIVLWEAKARELDLDYMSILTWYKSKNQVRETENEEIGGWGSRVDRSRKMGATEVCFFWTDTFIE
ncbi:hypothetical protein FSP39_003432 [Pinctada imbricata]|uniref:MADF domain-containing protein n=1 Tax=Pinctada imbricata TaxID=66713 RepID=A0AA88XTN1_PINIB|nr:hypothetical protein FSP39_003432 [Pinctada imbricata]